MEGEGFEPEKLVVRPLYTIRETLSPNFDLSIAKNKVRVRSLQDSESILFTQNPFASLSPVYEVLPTESTIDDPRFSIDMSVMKGLNDEIMSIFSDYTYLDNSLGPTNLQFSEKYPDLIDLRNVYFNNVLEKIDLGRYRELFKWIDNSFTDLVSNLLPHTTRFMGINFVYENHVLERNRFKYLYDEIYLKSKPLVSDRNLLLSQFVIRLRRM